MLFLMELLDKGMVAGFVPDASLDEPDELRTTLKELLASRKVERKPFVCVWSLEEVVLSSKDFWRQVSECVFLLMI